MRYRRLGDSGLLVSAVGLGTNNFGWRLDRTQAGAVLDACGEQGVTLVDTADLYAEGGAEELLGDLLRGRRDQFVVATKVGLRWERGPRRFGINREGLSARYLKEAVDASLGRLRSDWIDVLQLHLADPLTPIEETLRALDDLVTAGKVRYIGCSNFFAWELTEAVLLARHQGRSPPVSVQSEYSMLARDVEAELLPACRRLGVGVLAYRPLAQGFLTGKYRRGAAPPEGTRLAGNARQRELRLTSANFDRLDALEAFAAEHGKPIGQLAVAWLLARDEVASVIAGASDPGQVEANAGAAQWRLTDQEVAELDALLPEPAGTGVGAAVLRRRLDDPERAVWPA